MNWDAIGDTLLGKGLPLLGGVLGGGPGAAVGGMIASALGVENTPEAVEQVLASDPDAVLKLKQLESDHTLELQRMTFAAETANLAQVNETMRAELASGDKFSKRWRPLFGYMFPPSFCIQINVISYQMIMSPNDAANLILAMTGLTTLWGIGFMVLGVNINQRSNDKARMLGQQPGGLVSRAVNAVLPGQ